MLEVWYTTIYPTQPKIKEIFGNSNFVHRFWISGPDLRITAGKPSRIALELQRFLISSPDLRITADFSRELAPVLQRFLISALDLAIAAASRRCKEEWPACNPQQRRATATFRVRFYYSSRKRGEADLSWQSQHFWNHFRPLLVDTKLTQKSINLFNIHKMWRTELEDLKIEAELLYFCGS